MNHQYLERLESILEVGDVIKLTKEQITHLLKWDVVRTSCMVYGITEKHKFVVVKAEMTGGGGSQYDSFPDGWHVWASLLHQNKYSPSKSVIHFTQSGCFSHNIGPVRVVGKMEQKITFTY